MKKQLLFGKLMMMGLVIGLFSGLVLTGCSSQKNNSPVFSQSSATPRSISTRLADAIVYSKINRKMISDDLVNAGPIQVDVYNGVAYLKGSVENNSQKRMAADLTRGVEGVIRVENLLVVKRTIP